MLFTRMYHFSMWILLFASVGATPASPPPPPFNHIPQPAYHSTPKHEEPKPYQYAYGVRNEHTGTNFEASENFDGTKVNGHYSVLLPDGRCQNVRYIADQYGGYIADVSYESYVHKPAPDHTPARSTPYHPPPPRIP